MDAPHSLTVDHCDSPTERDCSSRAAAPRAGTAATGGLAMSAPVRQRPDFSSFRELFGGTPIKQTFHSRNGGCPHR
jgi:hypothetical protein